MGEDRNTTRDPRRRLLRTIAAGGSAAGLAALPGKWAKPVVASVILPAHAETSPAGCVGTLDNCPSGTDSDSFSTSKYATFTNAAKYPGITFDNGTLSGSDGTQKYSVFGSCPAPCDDVEGATYFEKTLDFNGTGASWGFSGEYRCGGEPVAAYSASFYGTPGTLPGKYTGTFDFGFTACKYLESTMMRERSPQAFRNFRFGN